MRRVLRLAALVLAATAVAATAPGRAESALFFLFNPTSARPGDRVAIRTGGTPVRFGPNQRVRPFQRPIRLFVVSNAVAAEVTSPQDPRLHFIGALVADKNGHGVTEFIVPRLDPDSYTLAAVCPACARYSFGRTFSVIHVDDNIVPRYRPLMLLRVYDPSRSGLAGLLQRLLEFLRQG